MSLLANVLPAAKGGDLGDSRSLSTRTNRVLYAIGTALFLATLVYLAVRISQQWGSLKDTRIQSRGWFAASAFVYATCHVSTALAWPFALRVRGDRIPLSIGIRIGLVAQVGKYLPGNVVHYFGRAALGKSVGVKLSASGVSTGIEIACAVIAAVALAPGALLGIASERLLPFLFVGSVLLAAAVAALCLWLARARASTITPISWFAATAATITASLFLSGASAYCMLQSISALSAPLLYIVGTFAVAWIAGLLTPGAPGGLGVREAIIVALLGPRVGAATALACAILHRAVTAFVDLFAGVSGYVWLAVGIRANR